MKTIVRKAGVCVAALIFAVTLTAATGLPRPAPARCGAGVTSHIWSELDSRQTSDTVGGKTTSTQDLSHRLEINSDNGVNSTHLDTHRTNADGSSHGHQELHVSDQGIGGKDCYPEMDGKPWKGDVSTDDDTDAKGNRKEHTEEIIDKNGKCTKFVRDREWDSKGKLIKDVKSETDVPCGKYILEWSRVGNLSEGGVTILWGPNTTKIYLEPGGDGTYKGKGEGVFDQKYSGKCAGWLTHPFSVDVTAKEVKFGDQDELDFSVKVTMRQVGSITCEGKSLDEGSPPVTFTRTFSLPAEDGASTTDTFPMQGGQLTDTFTLKKR